MSPAAKVIKNVKIRSSLAGDLKATLSMTEGLNLTWTESFKNAVQEKFDERTHLNGVEKDVNDINKQLGLMNSSWKLDLSKIHERFIADIRNINTKYISNWQTLFTNLSGLYEKVKNIGIEYEESLREEIQKKFDEIPKIHKCLKENHDGINDILKEMSSDWSLDVSKLKDTAQRQFESVNDSSQLHRTKKEIIRTCKSIGVKIQLNTDEVCKKFQKEIDGISEPLSRAVKALEIEKDVQKVQKDFKASFEALLRSIKRDFENESDEFERKLHISIGKQLDPSFQVNGFGDILSGKEIQDKMLEIPRDSYEFADVWKRYLKLGKLLDPSFTAPISEFNAKLQKEIDAFPADISLNDIQVLIGQVRPIEGLKISLDNLIAQQTDTVRIDVLNSWKTETISREPEESSSLGEDSDEKVDSQPDSETDEPKTSEESDKSESQEDPDDSGKSNSNPNEEGASETGLQTIDEAKIRAESPLTSDLIAFLYEELKSLSETYASDDDVDKPRSQSKIKDYLSLIKLCGACSDSDVAAIALAHEEKPDEWKFEATKEKIKKVLAAVSDKELRDDLTLIINPRKIRSNVMNELEVLRATSKVRQLNSQVKKMKRNGVKEDSPEFNAAKVALQNMFKVFEAGLGNTVTKNIKKILQESDPKLDLTTWGAPVTAEEFQNVLSHSEIISPRPVKAETSQPNVSTNPIVTQDESNDSNSSESNEENTENEGEGSKAKSKKKYSKVIRKLRKIVDAAVLRQEVSAINPPEIFRSFDEFMALETCKLTKEDRENWLSGEAKETKGKYGKWMWDKHCCSMFLDSEKPSERDYSGIANFVDSSLSPEVKSKLVEDIKDHCLESFASRLFASFGVSLIVLFVSL